MAYTKLFNSIVTSTIWTEDDKTRIVWITMLAIADKNGEVQGSIPGLARIAAVPVEACRTAIAKFLSPDPDSRTKDDEGRRIEEIDGGWSLLNHQKYREMASKDESREAEAKRKARYRAKLARNGKEDESQNVPDMSHDVPKTQHIAEAEAEADTKRREEPPLSPKGERVKKEPSEDGKKFAAWFRSLLPESLPLPATWKADFARSYDEMIRIDKRTDDEISEVCEFGTNDPFWSKQLKRPGYLRKISKTVGIQHFDQILDAARAKPEAKQRPTVNLATCKL
jgi:hypothetical protein